MQFYEEKRWNEFVSQVFCLFSNFSLRVRDQQITEVIWNRKVKTIESPAAFQHFCPK